MSIPNQVRYCFLFISLLTLETYVLIMDSLDLVISFLDILLMLLLDFCNPYIKTTQYNVLLDVLLKLLTFIFSRIHNDIKGE